MKPCESLVAAAACCCFLAITAGAAEPQSAPPEWKAGCATVTITPERPMAMAGYAGRKDNPAEGTEQELFAKALAIEDKAGTRLVIVTTDLIGITAGYRTKVAAAVAAKHQLPAEALFMNASHTHCGPAYGREDTADYFSALVEKTVALVGDALARLEAASLHFSTAKCGFAMNRRTPSPQGFLNHPNPDGPVDHTVPVLSVKDAQGKLKTVLFGYACHNTTMGFMKWFGDYAGCAQQCLQTDHEGLTAMFMNGCSGDQNPYPRSLLYFAQRHGRSLATSVEAALEFNQTRLFHQRAISGPIRAILETVNLPFTEESKRGSYDYPVHVVKLGPSLTLIGLGSEATIDYSLRLKRELSKESGPAIWVAGYSNDYNGYVPSRRVLLEGGYEASSRPWDPGLEEKIIAKVHELIGR